MKTLRNGWIIVFSVVCISLLASPIIANPIIFVVPDNFSSQESTPVEAKLIWKNIAADQMRELLLNRPNQSLYYPEPEVLSLSPVELENAVALQYVKNSDEPVKIVILSAQE